MTEIPCKLGVFSSTELVATAVEWPRKGCYARRFPTTRDARRRVEHLTETPADDLWNAIAGRLRDTLTETTYDTWFGQARPQSLRGEQLVVEVPNDFTRDWIEGHFHDVVSRAASESVTGTAVSFTVGERQPARPEPPTHIHEAPRERVDETPTRETVEVALNRKYTFDLFVIGSSNRFAHAAALAVAEAPAQAYNPLFIYGGARRGGTPPPPPPRGNVLPHPAPPHTPHTPHRA